jgi:tRNA(Ile)-lysidine synthase
LGSIKGDLRRLSFRDIEAVRCLAEQKSVTLPGKLLLRREEGLISVPEKGKAHQGYEINWDGKKDLLIPETGLFFAGKRVEKGDRKIPAYNDKKRALTDAAKLVFPLLIRARRDGDRYRPLGSPGRRKLKEIMRAKGVPVAERDSRPVFLSRGRIIWVPGLPIAEDVKITPATKTVFIIENLPRDSSFSKFRKPKAPRADG